MFDLVRLLTGRGADELTHIRADLEQMATEGKKPIDSLSENTWSTAAFASFLVPIVSPIVA